MAERNTTPVRVKHSEDPQVREMVADPAGYFARAREEARREARTYVDERLRRARPA
jgi:hypothetical protein